MGRVPTPVSLDGESGMPLDGKTHLLQQIVDQFCPRFTGGGEIWHVSELHEPSAVPDVKPLWASELGLKPGTKMPDVVVRHATEDWLLLIEAVASDRALDEICHDERAVSVGADLLRLVYVVAFADRTALRQRAIDIPWGTHVWFAAEPDHLVHVGGTQLLGPRD